ncbi:MAG: hypothetical protein K9N09_04180 [Candidatus Cloacimonetes bacterium]|nr:hypothetical protein [Candidatus Cloacimonadota bacterium]MCF7814485.1 hypothetical protein [Candidatus Cloacimonadota bacterium]MCF7867877.1 hypothetical protein [Candidatus Cloacimonadota bacterium]MCF7883696.1 hypothetical protein [Candidatus Cloacimonadota bacterium]
MSAHKQIDRRWIFLLIFICVALPLIFVIGLPIETTENSRLVYDLVQNTPPGSKVILSFDYDPGSKPELHPMATAVMKNCLERNVKVIITALWPMGVQMAEEIHEELKTEYPQMEYGVDYVNLGFKAGGMVTVQAMGKSFRTIFPTDLNGTSINELPIMNGVKNFDNIAFVCSFSAGDPGIKQWVQITHDTFGKPVTGGVTGVSAPAVLPYVNEQQQLTGLLAGLKGAAEYEFMVKKPGTATSGMDAQSIAHLLIIIFIAIGNINYWRNKKKEAKGGE